MSLLKLPSVKLLVKHVKNCEMLDNIQDPDSSSKPSLQAWKCTLPQGSVNFSVVWIQGHILEVEDSGNKALISDGSGQIRLIGCDKVSVKSEIKKGMYMMAVGTLAGGQGSQPEIKPFKLQNLSHVNQAQESWHLEVTDQIHYLIGQVK